MNEDELFQELVKAFREEASERLNSISTNLIIIEQTFETDDYDTVLETVYRDAHSLKGAARAVKLGGLEKIFHVLETFFSGIKNKKISFKKNIFDFLQDTVSELGIIIAADNMNSTDMVKKQQDIFTDVSGHCNQDNIKIEQDNNKSKEIDAAIKEVDVEAETNIDVETENIERDSAIVTNGDDITELSKQDATSDFANKEKVKTETVRLSSSKLDSILLQSENLIRIKQILGENLSFLQDFSIHIDSIKQKSVEIFSDISLLRQTKVFRTLETENNEIYRSIEKIHKFLEDNQKFVSSSEKKFRSLLNINKEYQYDADKIIDTFLSEIKEISMIPFSNTLSMFPGMIREMARNMDKEIIFNIAGSEIKTDRRILQEIKDPLIHIIRNSIDHGIEDEKKRLDSGKNKVGKIELSISNYDINKIEIKISDDGQGLDLDAIKKEAIKNELITEKELKRLSEKRLINFIFKSGFSTKGIITDLSGRGLGMSIVKEKFESLGGNVFIESVKGKGTTIKILLPVKLATFKGVFVSVGEHPLIIPSVNVREVLRTKREAIHTVENKRVIHYNMRTYPLVSLAAVIGIDDGDEETKEENPKKGNPYLLAAIVNNGDDFIALEVDQINDECEVIVKDLGSMLKKVPHYIGATILSSGKIAPVLNLKGIFESASSMNIVNFDFELPGELEGKTTNILIAEDSITSRMLLKNILEAAGYNVDAAVNGAEAFSLLKTKAIDLVVSDVEMPKMNGFALTENIRKTERFKDLPVILVTTRSSEEDKAKGMDAGANAYIIKSEFEQSNLLNIISSLL